MMATMVRKKWTVGKPPRKGGRPLGKKWDNILWLRKKNGMDEETYHRRR